MRVPLSWLREYVDVPADGRGPRRGRRPGPGRAGGGGDPRRRRRRPAGGRAGCVDFADEPQSNGKTIRWCQVGRRPGERGRRAPGASSAARDNFESGDLVVVSLPGAVLAGGFAISARKTYGHVSDGMICSARELGLGDDHAGIIRLAELGLGDAPVGTDAIALLGLDDQTLEVNVTPDRGYALSVRGVAREYAHATGATFTDPALVAVPAPDTGGFRVRVEDAAPVRGTPGCDRYVARVVRGVDAAAPSPRWMRRRLEQAGMRPISLAVDVTNYVMLAVGQPLHAFDLAGLREAIVVRRARPGERLTTLDDVDRALHPEDLLITDTRRATGCSPWPG